MLFKVDCLTFLRKEIDIRVILKVIMVFLRCIDYSYGEFAIIGNWSGMLQLCRLHLFG